MYMLPSPKYKYARSCPVRGKEVSLYSTLNNLQINIMAIFLDVKKLSSFICVNNK